jgi:hypothetical protein
MRFAVSTASLIGPITRRRGREQSQRNGARPWCAKAADMWPLLLGGYAEEVAVVGEDVERAVGSLYHIADALI